ncbi:ROK family protein [Candidatus Saccharibacteria bacterium]|nr:MAG: ROK family protein [Candidatus Saccharibacteria bacterium]
MYICIDIGGTKTLVAALTNEGVISESVRFPTPKDYDEFLRELTNAVKGFKTQGFRAGATGMPVTIFDRKRCIGVSFSNLPWQKVPIQRDLEKLFACPMLVENDAKLAALSESMLIKDYRKILYVTISTGIGEALVVNNQIITAVGDGGGRTMLFEYKGKMTPWEDFAGGKAIAKTYGKPASEIHDPAIWKKIARNLTPGFLQFIAILQPEVIVVGGGAGHYLERFHDALVADLRQYETPMLQIPPIIPAQRPEEAVVYGCYDYARQNYS